jgi:hypothetical protein
LLAHVGDGQPIPTEGERWNRFEVLDRVVWTEARRLDLQGDLPQAEAGDCQYLGKTNLPGHWILIPHEFRIMGLRAWKSDLLALRALADSTPETEPTPQIAKGGRPKKGSKPSTNALLIDLFNDRPDCRSWSSRRLGEITHRSRSAIENTPIYKAAEEIRMQTRAELALRKARRRE